MKPRLDPTTRQQRLAALAASLAEPYQKIAQKVLNDPRFWESPGSTNKHHAFDGGLAEHTLEVAEVCDFLCAKNKELNRNQLLLASIWHDYGKIFDYVRKERSLFGWGETPHAKTTRHLVKGYTLFCEAARGTFSDDEIDEIGHLILAHHGQKEWGSPVTPVTKEAWGLHLADMLSKNTLSDRTGAVFRD